MRVTIISFARAPRTSPPSAARDARDAPQLRRRRSISGATRAQSRTACAAFVEFSCATATARGWPRAAEDRRAQRARRPDDDARAALAQVAALVAEAEAFEAEDAPHRYGLPTQNRSYGYQASDHSDSHPARRGVLGLPTTQWLQIFSSTPTRSNHE